MRAVRTPSERLLEALLVELMDGIACRLRIAAEVADDLIGVVAIGAGEQDLSTAKGEGIRRRQSRLERLALGVAQGTHVDRSFHRVEDNH